MSEPGSGRAAVRLECIAALLSCAFWALCLGIIVLFIWLAMVGGLKPADVVPLTGAVVALAVIWGLRARIMSSRSFETSRHPDVVKQYERRGFY